ncbi:MAG: hypothetical protein HC882_05840 [Acidobacteria bacterium]|nr:hypothetical protein [Acidobacteriota bacterium]
MSRRTTESAAAAASPSSTSTLLLSSSLQLVAGVGISGLLLIAVRVALARGIGADGLGVVSTIWTAASTVAVLAIAGVTPLVTKYLVQYRSMDRADLSTGLLRASAAWGVGLSLLLTAGLTALATPLASAWLNEPSSRGLSSSVSCRSQVGLCSCSPLRSSAV